MRKKFVYPLLRLSWASYSIKATKSGTMQVNVENPQGGIKNHMTKFRNDSLSKGKVVCEVLL